MTVKNATLALPWGVLYRHPNPDGSRKACRNCFLWIRQENRCVIHAKDVTVREFMYCGFYVFGKSQEHDPNAGVLQPVEPSLSGLRAVGGGASCDTCVYFEHGEATGQAETGKGSCYGVANPSNKRPPVPVEDLGICARHQAT